ncbi:hypothetical protein GC163_15095 [bacterium]|nr:hypothetical protein [bacterium]
MSISIISCPQCQAMVLSDAVRCHVCDHLLDQHGEEELPTPALPTDEAVADDLEVCKTCGETYRTGLVRCWNCGSFTRDDIKAAFDRMSSDPGRVAVREQQFPELPEVTSRSGPWKISAVARHEQDPRENAPLVNSSGEELAASDDDFSFELADDIHLSDAPEEPPLPETDETYGLAEPEVAEAPAPTVVYPVVAVEPEAAPAEIPPLETPQRSVAPEENTVAHSEATAGDVLLKIAQQEEVDIAQTKKNYASKVRGGFVVYCPMGCRIRVQDRHRGKAGKCPKCGSVFFVPRKQPKPKVDAVAAEAAPVAAAVEKWRGWTDDVHLHSVLPQKLRIKPDSLLKEFIQVDLVASAEGLLVMTLVAAPGFMGANLKKKPAIRAAAQEHLRTVGNIEGLQVAQQRWYPTEMLSQLSIAQPSPADVESLFGNIPVFGTGRIAVRLPRLSDGPAIEYLSFSLGGFRQFAEVLSSVCGVSGLGSNTEIPLSETYNTVKCHYSDFPVQELLGVEYYQKDPAFKLQITGWRCGGCGLVVSEDSRKKEKIGGLNGKAIAKAKCPKCVAKFGQHPMYAVEVPPVEATAPAEAESVPA